MKTGRITTALVLLMLVLFGTVAMAGGAKEKAVPEPSAPAAEAQAAEAAVMETPQYGGVFNMCQTTSREFMYNPFGDIMLQGGLMYESFIQGDWYIPRDKWEYGGPWFPPEHWAGWLAESWEMNDPATVTIKLRSGIHWWNRPPANGRELVAADIKKFFMYFLESPKTYKLDLVNIDYIDCPDKYTVVFHLKEPRSDEWLDFLRGNPTGVLVANADLIEEQGEEAYNDYLKVIGTGPFIPTEHVSGNYGYWASNPGYWKVDKAHDNNKLPYLDGVMCYYMPDEVTRLAALRSGQLDEIHYGISPGGQENNWKYVESVAETNPEILSKASPGFPGLLAMNTQSKPFTDVRVRQALNMAVNHPAIVKEFYKGHAYLPHLVCPFPPDWGEMSIGEEEWSPIVREMFGYNPEKAKQLLAEAGYPDGFDTHVVTVQQYTKILPYIQQDLKAIGVNMEIKVVEWGAHRGMRGKQPQIWCWTEAAGPQAGSPINILTHAFFYGTDNYGQWHDPNYEGRLPAAQSLRTAAERNKEYKKLAMYVMEQAPHIFLPAPQLVSFWQPWVKNFQGEWGLMKFPGNFVCYFWIDQALKKKITGK